MIKYEVFTVEEDRENGIKKGEIRVKFPEYDEEYCTSVDENGERYFSVPNILNGPVNALKRLYTGRIKDAYDMVMNGDADCITVTQMFGFKNIHAVKFVNEEYGKKQREKFIEGWKDVVFGWGIEAGNKCGFSGFSPVCENMCCYNPYMKPEENAPVFFFNTENEAKAKLSEILKNCENYAMRYKMANTEEEQENCIKSMINEHGDFSVYLSYLIAQEDEENDYSFRLVQSMR